MFYVMIKTTWVFRSGVYRVDVSDDLFVYAGGCGHNDKPMSCMNTHHKVLDSDFVNAVVPVSITVRSVFACLR